jgi:F-type H+-transporting ATPase subunit gamma
MQNLAAIAAHERGVERLIPLLSSIQSVAEIGWRRAHARFQPLHEYGARLQTLLAQLLGALEAAQREALARQWAGGQSTGLLVIGSERGLCGAFNERLVSRAVRDADQLLGEGRKVTLLCLGTRARRALDQAGRSAAYFKPLPSLSVPSYADIESVTLDLLGMLEQGTFAQLVVLHNAPTQRFQYGAVRTVLGPPPVPPTPVTGVRSELMAVEPAEDVEQLVAHLVTESVLLRVYEAVLASVVSEQLARMYAMRLAVERAKDLLARLRLQHNVAWRQQVTTSLLETISGYEAAQEAP